MRRTILITLIIIIISLIFYFSWLPDPSFKTQPFLPNWLIIWTDHYGNLRTAIPFVLLGFCLSQLDEFKNDIQAANFKRKVSYRVIKVNIIIATSVVVVAELGQFLLSRRHPDIIDVFFGILGTVAGILLALLLTSILRKKTS
jgi:glycopeptide antibiotics resistance protein